jgi:hypothetical protein
MLDSALILLAAAVSWLFGYRVGKWRGGDVDKAARAGAWIVCCGEALPRLQGPRVPLLRPISRPHVPAGAGHGHGHHDSGVSPNASAAANARHSDQHDNSGGR